MTGDLDGRVAIVTGGASGLGAAISRAAAAAGAHVVIADIDGDAATWVAREVGGTPVTCDVTQSADVQRMVEVAAGRGPIRALVLSAAVETRTPVVDCTDDEWDRVIGVNLTGPFLCLRATIPHMIDAGGGAVVAMGSTLGQVTSPGYPAYCASKTALTNLCKQAAIEHAKDGVRVNVLAPSATESGLFMKVTEPVPHVRQQVAAQVPMGRLGREDDVTAAVLYLLGDGSTYLSGAVIPLDGGLAARRS
ncbi:MAG TPA: SDR family oxidoreductase [Mycobacteriales bacterium]|nr:SDR family oxidoreductase [Mycobacteriales bacterium]